MNTSIEKIKKFRISLINQIRHLTPEAVNEIPVGHNNNIIWNLVHLIAAQQGLCYLRSSQKPVVADKYIMPFFTNTKPERLIDQEEFDYVIDLFTDTIDQLKEDYDNGMFAQYTASPNILSIYGIELKTIEDAFEFLLYHEGYHGGIIMSLKKLVHQNKNLS